ncbi:MAG: 3'-5' exonuclease, partial [Bdellovibrionota bacterium]
GRPARHSARPRAPCRPLRPAQWSFVAGRPIPPEATNVNKITNDMVVGKPTIDTLLAAFAEFCGDELLVAHNAPFDCQFLVSDIKKFETPAPRGIVVDTLPIARKVVPGLANYKLGTLITHFKIPSGQYHRAEEDATYCGNLFENLVKRISINGQPPQVENLVALTGKPEFRFPQIEKQPKQLDLLSFL